MGRLFYKVIEMITDWVTSMEMSSGLNLMNGDFAEYMEMYEFVTVLMNVCCATVLVGTVLMISVYASDFIKKRRSV